MPMASRERKSTRSANVFDISYVKDNPSTILVYPSIHLQQGYPHGLNTRPNNDKSELRLATNSLFYALVALKAVVAEQPIARE